MKANKSPKREIFYPGPTKHVVCHADADADADADAAADDDDDA